MWFQRNKAPRVTEAQKALLEAKLHQKEVSERETEVHEVAEASRNLRRDNHFAEDLQALFGGGPR